MQIFCCWSHTFGATRALLMKNMFIVGMPKFLAFCESNTFFCLTFSGILTFFGAKKLERSSRRGMGNFNKFLWSCKANSKILFEISTLKVRNHILNTGICNVNSIIHRFEIYWNYKLWNYNTNAFPTSFHSVASKIWLLWEINIIENSIPWSLSISISVTLSLVTWPWNWNGN